MNKELTKEECLEALKGLIYKSEVNETEWLEDKQCWLVKDAYQRKIGLLFQLINENFDNPPLKFEELEEITPTWDNVNKIWISLFKCGDSWRYETFGSEITGPFKFEENRYFRYEVKEVKE